MLGLGLRVSRRVDVSLGAHTFGLIVEASSATRAKTESQGSLGVDTVVGIATACGLKTSIAALRAGYGDFIGQ